MPGKRVRLVRSSCSIDNMTMLNQPISPPERQMQVKPPSCLPIVPKAKTNVSQSGILTLWSPKMKMDSCDQGLSGNFLNICNYCKKNMGHEDDIYMYSSLQAFCSSECRDRQIVVEKPVITKMEAAASAWSTTNHHNYIHGVVHSSTTEITTITSSHTSIIIINNLMPR